MILQAAYTPRQASNYIGIDTGGDALKASRSTGTLWGVTEPAYLQPQFQLQLIKIIQPPLD